MADQADRPTPRKRGIYIHRLHDSIGVRRELTRIYRSMRRSEIDTLDGWRLAQVLMLIHKVIEGGEILPRLEELERLAQRRQGLAA